MIKIGILIPSTNKGLNCKSYKDTHFYNIFMKSFLETRAPDYHFKIYLVVDDDDTIYSKLSQKTSLENYVNSKDKLSIKFISSRGIDKGHVTAMWNRAFSFAYNDNCDYFYQIGDDVLIMDKGWESYFIAELRKMGDIGMVAPFDWGRYNWEVQNNIKQKFILTQSFVSRMHYKIFGFYFNPRIKNWFCDDWITGIYITLGRISFKKDIRIVNKGGLPRYTPPQKGAEYTYINKLCNILIGLDSLKIKKYIELT